LKANNSHHPPVSVAAALKSGLLALLILLVGGCASLVIDPLVGPLTNSLEKQTDLRLIADGTPTLLLMIDGLTAEHPDNKKLLLAGVESYSAYTNTIYELGETERAARLSSKARDYGKALLRLSLAGKEGLPTALDEFTNRLALLNKDEVPALFWSGYGWGTWIRLQDGSPASLADLPKVEQIMLRVVELDESYYHGAAHIFLGFYYGSRPEGLGGNLEKSRYHFERALQLSDRNFLLTQVTYAESYARLTFNRELFTNLLTEVLNHKDAENSELAASNQLAKIKAAKLLGQIDAYF
jgi:hypothetical protein